MYKRVECELPEGEGSGEKMNVHDGGHSRIFNNYKSNIIGPV